VTDTPKRVTQNCPPRSPGRGNNPDLTDAMIHMRLEGKSYREIGEHFGCSVRNVFKRISRRLKTIRVEEAEQLIRIEESRLDEMFNAVYPDALSGNLRAVKACLSIMERRAALRGLDAPKRVETKEEIRRIATVEIKVPKVSGSSPAALIEGEEVTEEAEFVEVDNDE
jgi:hypothetical protein